VPRARLEGGLFSQADIAVSVLDYLGISSEGLMGQSIFRTYASDRTVIFGNVFTSKIYTLATDGSLYACSIALDCSAYRTEQEKFFRGSLLRESVNEGYLAEMRQALSRNEFHSAQLDTRYVFIERNKEYRGTRWLLGDHKIQADRNDRITWTIRIKAEDPVTVVARALLVESEDAAEDLFNRITHLESREEFQFSYHFSPEYDAAWIWTKVYVIAEKASRFQVLELTLERSKQ
jgi:hypothetical protein